MGDMGEIFNAMKDRKRQHREEREAAQSKFVAWMQDKCFEYRPLPGGYRFFFVSADCSAAFDYFPKSGRWTRVGTNKWFTGEKGLRTVVNVWASSPG